jgi:hypothetical protein
MYGKIGRVYALAGLFLLAVLCRTWAQDTKAKEEPGKAEEFKSKTFDLKEKGKKHITLIFPEGKKATITVRSKEKTDINLFIYDDKKKEVAKDDSPGPDCDIEFTPKKAGKYTLEIVNLGKGANSSTLKIEYKK